MSRGRLFLSCSLRLLFPPLVGFPALALLLSASAWISPHTIGTGEAHRLLLPRSAPVRLTRAGVQSLVRALMDWTSKSVINLMSKRHHVMLITLRGAFENASSPDSHNRTPQHLPIGALARHMLAEPCAESHEAGLYQSPYLGQQQGTS